MLSLRSPVNCPVSDSAPGGGGGLPYKSDGGARRIFLKKLLKGTKILFYGRGPKVILTLRGTKIKHHLSVIICIGY